MHFPAYSPLAGGFLSGKATNGDTAGTRFEKGNRMGEMHQGWYDREVMHEGVWKLDEFIKPLGVSLTEVAMRWYVYHCAIAVLADSRFCDSVLIFTSSRALISLKSQISNLARWR